MKKKSIAMAVLMLIFIAPVFAEGIYNETTMPKNTGETYFWFSIISIIIIFAFIFIMLLKDAIVLVINLVRGK